MWLLLELYWIANREKPAMLVFRGVQGDLRATWELLAQAVEWPDHMYIGTQVSQQGGHTNNLIPGSSLEQHETAAGTCFFQPRSSAVQVLLHSFRAWVSLLSQRLHNCNPEYMYKQS